MKPIVILLDSPDHAVFCNASPKWPYAGANAQGCPAAGLAAKAPNLPLIDYRWNG